MPSKREAQTVVGGEPREERRGVGVGEAHKPCGRRPGGGPREGVLP